MTHEFTITPRLHEIGRDGHCQHHPTLDWFTESHPMIEACKQICAECPTRERCLEHAMTWPERWGIWGGTTPPERGFTSRHKQQKG